MLYRGILKGYRDIARFVRIYIAHTRIIACYIHKTGTYISQLPIPAGVLCMYLSEFLLFSGEKKGKEEGKEGGKEEGREGRRFNNTIETCQSSQLLC